MMRSQHEMLHSPERCIGLTDEVQVHRPDPERFDHMVVAGEPYRKGLEKHRDRSTRSPTTHWRSRASSTPSRRSGARWAAFPPKQVSRSTDVGGSKILRDEIVETGGGKEQAKAILAVSGSAQIHRRS